jgi:hypothetical protein
MPTNPTNNNPHSLVTQLQELSELHQAGSLSESEFAKAKALLLGEAIPRGIEHGQQAADTQTVTQRSITTSVPKVPIVPLNESNSTKHDRQKFIIFVLACLITASIVYCPNRVTRWLGPNPLYSDMYNSAGVRTNHGMVDTDHIEYAFIWNTPAFSSIDFGRLALTWLGILLVTSLSLFMNYRLT